MDSSAREYRVAGRVAPPLLTPLRMPEPDDTEDHAERRVVVETVTSSSTKNTGITIAIIVVIAVALIVWVVMQMR
jgi:hypothetical protein